MQQSFTKFNHAYHFCLIVYYRYVLPSRKYFTTQIAKAIPVCSFRILNCSGKLCSRWTVNLKHSVRHSYFKGCIHVISLPHLNQVSNAFAISLVESVLESVFLQTMYFGCVGKWVWLSAVRDFYSESGCRLERLYDWVCPTKVSIFSICNLGFFFRFTIIAAVVSMTLRLVMVQRPIFKKVLVAWVTRICQLATRG